jgi:hypothetical protein
MMIVEFEKNIDLYFFGNRNYVKAALLLKFAVFSICKTNKDGDLGNYHLVRFKQTDEVHRCVELIPESELKSTDTTKSQIDIKCAGSLKRYFLIDSGRDIQSRISERYTLLEVIIAKDQHLQATAKVPSTVDFWELLSEVVELTKKLHQSKYNDQQEKFRFVVGGFEKLDFFRTQTNSEIIVSCTIAKHFRHGGDIYNQCIINITQGETFHRFFLSFIGRSIL